MANSILVTGAAGGSVATLQVARFVTRLKTFGDQF